MLAAVLLAGLVLVFGGTSTVTVVIFFALFAFVAIAFLVMAFTSIRLAVRVARDGPEAAPVYSRPLPAWLSFAPRTERRIGWIVSVLAGCAFLVSGSIVVLDLVRTRPLHGVAWLLLPGIPILIVGQLWTILVLIKRLQPRRTGPWNPFSRRWRITAGDVFGDLPIPVWIAVIGISALLVISSQTTDLSRGGPVPPTRHCQYPLDNHGYITCTDEAAYYQAGRDVQRDGATVLAGFFVIHLAVAASSVFRRRRED